MKKIILFSSLVCACFSVNAQTLQSVTDNGASTSNTLNSFNPNGFQVTGTPGNPAYMVIDQTANSGGKRWRFGHTGAASGFNSFDILNITDGITPLSLAANGNVGIGTTAPGANLHVAGTFRWGVSSSNYMYTGQDGIGTYFEQVGSDADKSRIRFQTSKNGNGSSYSQFIIDPEKGFSFMNLGTGSSNVGIGTNDTKGYKLAVAGNMIAESVKVSLQGNWPDYVFAKDYELPTLQETEKHIKDKGHLPGIPSAAEVKANGVDLGEMNAKLLQKIEELTLHLIRLEKENAKQREDINELKSKR